MGLIINYNFFKEKKNGGSNIVYFDLKIKMKGIHIARILEVHLPTSPYSFKKKKNLSLYLATFCLNK